MKWVILCSLTLAIISWILVRRGTNNVCKTFEDYYSNRDSNGNCYYNPDGELEVPDIVKRHGYPIETHQVVTRDGYILTLFRIPYGKTSSDHKPRKPVFITHGMGLNAGAFLNTGTKSLGFILADAGYDVWLGNFRGTKYSRKHTHLNAADSKFWNFTFHELGIYDIPPQVDLIYNVTEQKIIYIAYSMGTTAAYVYSTTYPAQEKVKLLISLAPSVLFREMGLHVKYLSKLWPIIEAPVQALTKGKLSPLQPLPSTLHKLLCLPFPFQTKMCQLFEMLFTGFNYEQRDPETLPVTHQYNSDATSIKTITHYFQLINAEHFQHFDYGVGTNQRIYGTPQPPHYNLSNFKIPTYSVVALNDLGITKENIEILHNFFPKETKRAIYTVEHEKFTHMDFLHAKDVVPLLYNHLVTFINDL